MRKWPAIFAAGAGLILTAGGLYRSAVAQPEPAVGTAQIYTGVIEGYYGPPWSDADTLSLLRFLHIHGMNTFVYAPKDDPYQRAKWNLLYPSQRLAGLRRLVQAAAKNHVQFVYSISPGLTITYSSMADRRALERKLDQLRGIGVHTFMFSFDDIYHGLNATDQRRYGPDMAYAQADLTNDLLARERKRDRLFRVWFTPTVYRGLSDNSYWHSLKVHLDTHVPVIWTGPQTLSPTITADQVQTVQRWIGHPIVIWDNYPVNDYTYVLDKRPRLFLGPVVGREKQVPHAVAGYLFNPMSQAYASEISLWTGADYLTHPFAYRPQSSWQAALKSLGGPVWQALAVFASYNSTYYHDNTPPVFLQRQIDAFWTLPAREDPAKSALAQTFRQMAGLDSQLAKGLPNPRLYAEIRPWAVTLALQGRTGLQAIAVYAQYRERGQAALKDPNFTQALHHLQDLARQVDARPYSVAGDAVVTFIHRVLSAVTGTSGAGAAGSPSGGT